MKVFTSIFLLFTIFMDINPAMSQELIIKESSKSPLQIVEVLKSNIKSMDMNLVQHINHTEAADKVNMDLSPTHVLIFGNPEVGTRLMKADPMVAIELPLKILVWEQNGKTMIAYRDPNYLMQNYKLKGHSETISKMGDTLQHIIEEAIEQ